MDPYPVIALMNFADEVDAIVRMEGWVALDFVCCFCCLGDVFLYPRYCVPECLPHQDHVSSHVDEVSDLLVHASDVVDDLAQVFIRVRSSLMGVVEADAPVDRCLTRTPVYWLQAPRVGLSRLVAVPQLLLGFPCLVVVVDAFGSWVCLGRCRVGQYV